MTIKVTYNVTDVYVSETISATYINISYEAPSGGSSVWGGITGTLSNQTDLQNALNAKFDDPTGTTSQYLRGDGTLATFPTIPSGTVTSVGLTMPSAFSVANSPVTSSGTLAVTGAGDTTQYIAGDGSLVAFPIAGQSGTLVREVRNVTGATLTKGTVVYINGASGNKPTVAKALATGDATSAQTFGLIQADIPNNSNGYIVAYGDLDGLNTSAFAEGVQLYLSATTAGEYTSVKQYAPNHLVYIGVVTRQHVNQGRIEVRIQNGYELDEIHDVAAQTPSNNDALIYETATSLWKNKSIATALGYTPISGTGTNGQVAYFTGATSQAGSNNLFWNNTNVRLGIGTNTPTATFTQSQTQGVFGRYEIRDANANQNIASWDVYTNTLVTPDFLGKTAFKFEGGINNASKQYQIYVADIFTPHLALNGSGSLMLGSVVSSGQRLQVTGDTLLKGSGNTSATTALTVQNSDGTNLFRVLNQGFVRLGNAGATSPALFTITTAFSSNNLAGTNFSYYNYTTTESAVNGSFAISGEAFSSISAKQINIYSLRTFAPTSGTAAHDNLNISSTINQTGGANGITRGLYIQPTLTAAADWRSIEWSNNSGWGLYGAGTANNYMAGSLGIGQTTLTGSNLRISKAHTGSASAINFYIDSTIQSDVTNSPKVIATTLSTQAAAFTVARATHYLANQGTIGAGSTITTQVGFEVDNTLIGATINYGFFGNIASGTNRWNLYMAGLASNYLAGPLLIGTTTNPNNYNLYVFGSRIGANNGIRLGSGYSVIDVETGAGGLYLSGAQGALNHLYIPSTGNVLIGNTTDSGEKLQVTGTAKITGAATITNDTNGAAGLYIVNPNAGTSAISRLRIGSANSNWYFDAVRIGGNLSIKNDISGSAVELLSITNGGNLAVDTNTLFVDATNNSVSVGTTSINASAKLQVESTTQGFLPPRMTTVQKLAITSPATGLQVYDTTLNLMSFYNGTSWVNGGSGFENYIVQHSSTTYADNTTYYFGAGISAAATTQGLVSGVFSRNGTIRSIYLFIRSAASPTIEPITLTLFKSTGAAGSFTSVATTTFAFTGARITVNLTGLNISVSANDVYELSVAVPAMVTNPTNVILSGQIEVEY